jgi:hypothetical protein
VRYAAAFLVPAVMALVLVIWAACAIYEAGSRHANSKHCREVLDGVPVRTADGGVVCIGSVSVIRVYK